MFSIRREKCSLYNFVIEEIMLKQIQVIPTIT